MKIRRGITRRPRRRYSWMALAVAVAVTATGCTSGGNNQPAAGDSGQFVVAMQQASLRTLDPNGAYEPAAFIFEHALYSTLVTFKSDDLRTLQPLLAKTWDVSEDGKKYTFHLDSSAKFSTGAAVTATDVVFSMQRFKNLKGPGAFLLDSVDSVTAPSDDTVVFELNTSDFTFPWVLTSSALGVAEAKVVKEHGGTDDESASTTDKAAAWLDGNSAGSGPFVLESWTRGQQLVLKRNDSYWQTKPAYAKVIFKFVNDANTEQQLLQRGDAQIAIDLTADQVVGFASNDKIAVAKAPALNQVYLGWTRSPEMNAALAKPENGQAIKYAIDYQALVKLSQGAAVQAGSVVPSALEGSLSPDKGLKQDVAKAKEALAKAGNPGGFSFKLSYASDESAAGVSMTLLAGAIQSDLAKVGIKAQLDPQLAVNYLSAYRGGQLEATVHGWANDYPATSNFLPVFVPPGTVAQKRQHWPASPENQKIVDLAATAFQTKDDKQRAAMVTEALEQLNQIGPYAPLLDTQYQFAFDKSKVHGVTANSLWFIDLNNVSAAK